MQNHPIAYISIAVQAQSTPTAKSLDLHEVATETMASKSKIDTSSSFRVAASLLIILSSLISELHSQHLKILTMNTWSGLDYVGQARMGEYESPEVREARFRLLVDELKAARPDVIALQEANPVSDRAQTLAQELGYDHIYQRVNSGAKMCTLGWPVNLNEGVIILAKKELKLQFVDVWNLGDGCGFFGNHFSFHWKEQRAALVGKINIGSTDVYVVNVHMSSAVPDDSLSRSVARMIASAKFRDEQSVQTVVEDCFAEANSRALSVQILLDHVEKSFPDEPMILLGDFNADPNQPEIRRLLRDGRLTDAAALVGADSRMTWDPENNVNTRFSAQAVDARGDSLGVEGLLSAWYDAKPRRIDYIFLNERWRREEVQGSRLFLHRPVNGLFASDHFGILGTIDASRFAGLSGGAKASVSSTPEKQIEGFPILSYDTDVGFGYGAKGFFLNVLGYRESFDLTAFNSTKGERWYRFAFSIPDFELRQGKVYPISFDVIVDYDKYLKMNFYGLGKNSRWENGETYTREPLEILAVLSRGFSREFVMQAGVKYRTVRNLNYDTGSLFARTAHPIDFSRSSALSLYGDVRYDSRDSYINASRGEVVEAELESGGSRLSGEYTFSAATISLQSFHVLFYPKTVLAARIWGRAVDGTDLPIHILSSVGGNRTLRGSPQDRFLDKAAAVVNVEVRFPIYWRLGGVIGFDAGQVARSPGALTTGGWEGNPVAGLRFYMDTFVVRADLGFGKETTGFYLNFGQLF